MWCVLFIFTAFWNLWSLLLNYSNIGSLYDYGCQPFLSKNCTDGKWCSTYWRYSGSCVKGFRYKAETEDALLSKMTFCQYKYCKESSVIIILILYGCFWLSYKWCKNELFKSQLTAILIFKYQGIFIVYFTREYNGWWT